jgi:hypothetical protein
MQRRPTRHLTCYLALLLLGSIVPAGYAQEKAKKTIPNELPRSWSFEEIVKATPPSGVKDPVYVLAWSVTEDDRPCRVESCLVMRILEKDDGYGRWCLAHLYRHPDDKKPEWRVSMIHVSGEKGTKYYPGLWIHQCMRFKEKPGNKELYAALPTEEVRWSFDQEKGWRFVSCGVCEKSWQEAIGEKPTRFFGK